MQGIAALSSPLLLQDQLIDVERQANGAPAESNAVTKAKDLIMVIKPDRTALGLGSYALSSVFLASMLSFAKILGQKHMPVFEILLARSSLYPCYRAHRMCQGPRQPLWEQARLFFDESKLVDTLACIASMSSSTYNCGYTSVRALL